MITLDDLITRFGADELAQLTDREQYQVIDAAVVAKAIADAESEVESYLNAVGLVKRDAAGVLLYAAPVVPKPLIIKTCDIARYYLYENGVTAIVKERYEQAIAWLKLVMKNPSMLTGATDRNGNTDGINSGIYVLPNPVPSHWMDR